jgi:hypothetical protein
MLVSSTFSEQDETNQADQLLWLLVATGMGDITEYLSLLQP